MKKQSKQPLTVAGEENYNPTILQFDAYPSRCEEQIKSFQKPAMSAPMSKSEN